MRQFEPGQTIEMREVWSGKTWELRFGVVVHDEPEVITIFTAAGTPARVAADASGGRLRLPAGDWQLIDVLVPEDRSYLAVHPPGASHSVLLIWDGAFRLQHWYINLESELQRTKRGFDYEDRVLDVIVEPDMSSWRWKDEDELAEAVELGLFTAQQAAEFRAEGERALEWLLSRRPPYDREWLSWRPG